MKTFKSNSLNDLLKVIRSELNLTQKEFAERVSSQKERISKYERHEWPLGINAFQNMIDNLPEIEKLEFSIDFINKK